ncbi:MAG: ribonuclease H-like domain-containing protein [Alphaproteobacteria bacterium]|jgi:ribonuclease D|nr:ribonuclease H-like domain-containing protein [Alphaproteobacteria bacterium]
MAIHLHKNDLPDGVTFTGSIAVDTETLGLKPSRDRLCLVQLSQGDGEVHIVQFEPESEHNQDPYAAPNLKAVLNDRQLVKIFHFARFDLATIAQYLGVHAAPLWCTKIASKLVRTYTDRHGLKDLCRELLQVDLSKAQQSSDWGAPDISDAQLNYAASDVLHLHALKDKLETMLDREGRRPMAEACFDFVLVRSAMDLAGWEDIDIFSH